MAIFLSGTEFKLLVRRAKLTSSKEYPNVRIGDNVQTTNGTVLLIQEFGKLEGEILVPLGGLETVTKDLPRKADDVRLMLTARQNMLAIAGGLSSQISHTVRAARHSMFKPAFPDFDDRLNYNSDYSGTLTLPPRPLDVLVKVAKVSGKRTAVWLSGNDPIYFEGKRADYPFRGIIKTG